MCAIAGIFDTNGLSCVNNNIELLNSMCDNMKKRGPDSNGIFHENFVYLGHRRLSIIDLKTGDQPLFDKDKSIVIVFNGEIYNFKEIKNELVKLGYEFITSSDTEVVINGYKAFGIKEILNRMDGMFAFALYDLTTKELYICRDKFGEKPLFYTEKDGKFLFASELKAFAPNIKEFDIDTVALNLFLTLTYIPAPYTIYKGISRVNPSSFIKINVSGKKEFNNYYNLVDRIKENEESYTFNEAKSKLKCLVTESIRSRMISDVPLGAFLSGGIDSSIVSSIMAQISNTPINTFTIGFKEKEYDESTRARIVANHIKSNHFEHILDYKDVLDILDDIILYYDEPFGDSSAIPSFYVAKLAKDNVKVVLTGDCADECFAGYEKYLGRYYTKKYNKIPRFLRRSFENFINLIPLNFITNNLIRKIKKVTRNSGLSDFDIYYNFMSLGFNDEERKHLLLSQYHADIKKRIKATFDSYTGDSKLSREQYTDVKIVLEGDMFVKVDRACMHNSLENRAPFMNASILELSLNLPAHYKIHKQNKKYILKEAFKDILPKKTLSYRKSGFGVPIDYWFKNELKQDLSNLLSKDFIDNQGIFSYEAVQNIYCDHINGKENNKTKLWNLFVFQKWYLNNINNH